MKYLFLSKFKILTGEDWNVVMYDGIVAYGGVKVSQRQHWPGWSLQDKEIGNIILEFWIPRLLLLHLFVHLW